MKRIFVISVFTVFIGLMGVLVACAFFYPLEVYNTVQRLRRGTNDDGKDITPPNLTIQSPSSNITIAVRQYIVSGIVGDDSGVEGVYLIRNGLSPKKVSYSNMKWETNIANLAEGTNIIEVYAKDTLGNTSINHSVLIIVDTNAPTVQVSPGTITTNKAFTAVLNVNINYGHWSTNGTNFTEFTTNGTSVAISNTTTLHYFGSNSLSTSSTQSIVYTIDTNAPAAPGVSGDADSMNKTPTWSWNIVADAVKYRYSFVDGSGWTETTDTNFTPSTNLAVNSVNTLYVQAANILDNWSTSGTNTIVVLPRFTEINPGSLTSVDDSSIDLGDIDGDTDLDLILTGRDSNPISKIYTNDGNGGFTEINSGSLTAVNYGSIDLGDIDGDLDLDLILTGRDSDNNPVSEIYQNDGNGGFTEINTNSLTDVDHSSIKLGDINGDGTNDLILTGWDGSRLSKIYTNNGSGSFTEINSGSLTGVSSSSIDLGDIDGDGDLDLILTGYSSGGRVSKIYTNNGSGGFGEINPPDLIGVYNSSIVLGDINGDTNLDLILTGDFVNGTGGRVSKIYINDGSGSFTEINSGSLTGVSSSSIVLGDIDGDTDLDLILTGDSGSGLISKIYTNNGSGSFGEDTNCSTPDMSRGSIMLGDIDGDGDLDLILTGMTAGDVSKIYRNNTIN